MHEDVSLERKVSTQRVMDLRAAGRARLIASLTSDLVIGPDAAPRNAYCERRRGDQAPLP